LDSLCARFPIAMQLLKSLTLAALFGSVVFQLQGCGGDDDDTVATTVAAASTATTAAPASTTTSDTTAAAGGAGGNSTRRLEFDFTFNAAEDVHV